MLIHLKIKERAAKDWGTLDAERFDREEDNYRKRLDARQRSDKDTEEYYKRRNMIHGAKNANNEKEL